jgi:uncharacterized membrane protein
MRIQEKRDSSATIRRLRRHAPLVLASLAGIVAFLLLTTRQFTAGNALAGWNVGAVAYIGLSLHRMLRSNAGSINKRASELDFSDTFLLVFSIAASLASIAGIALELLGAKQAPPDIALAHAGMAILTILISWSFLHMLFTTHYAHRYYSRPGQQGEGLKFAEPVDQPIYWDFLYFSFTIGVAAQTADIGVTTVGMRKLVLLHAILSFLFNTTVLALAVNVGASLL